MPGARARLPAYIGSCLLSLATWASGQTTAVPRLTSQSLPSHAASIGLCWKVPETCIVIRSREVQEAGLPWLSCSCSCDAVSLALPCRCTAQDQGHGPSQAGVASKGPSQDHLGHKASSVSCRDSTRVPGFEGLGTCPPAACQTVGLHGGMGVLSGAQDTQCLRLLCGQKPGWRLPHMGLGEAGCWGVRCEEWAAGGCWSVHCADRAAGGC